MKKYSPVQITRLTDGGSERNFYRVRLGNRSIVYMNYSDEKEENRYYYDIAIFLKGLGINVPEIYYKGDGNIFLEDLGDTHLYNLVTTRPEDRIIDYYYKVIDQLSKLHSSEGVRFKISNGFDYSLYRWESKYFLDNLIRDYFGIKLDINIEPELHLLAEVLSKEKNVLIHRDCQSKNIMIKDGVPYFIDFQGLRYGLPEYDLASLLEDPYVNLSDEAKDNLYERGVQSTSSHIYKYCAIQRLMQALGAYAFLGLKKGKKEFLQYIPNGLNRLRLISEGLPRLNSLVSSIVPSVHAGGSQPVQRQ